MNAPSRTFLAPWIRYSTLIAAAMVLVAMNREIGRRPSAADAAPFHAAAAEAIAALPAKFGDWEGEEAPIPASATALLKPNAIMSRQFRNTATGQELAVTLVQCRETGDMAGHYPPICYPGMGWEERETRDRRVVDVGGLPVTMMRYEFIRRQYEQERTLVVYNVFAVPGQGMPIDMETIRAAAADYAARPFGAAQVQVVMTRPGLPDDERRVVESVLAPMRSVLELLSDPSWKKR